MNWFRNTDSPSPLVSGDGDAEIQTALAGWTTPATGALTLSFAGTTTATHDTIPAGNGVIMYEDPEDNISGSTLAFGGGFAQFGNGGTVNGTTFNKYTQGFVLFQNADVLCGFSTAHGGSFCESLNFSRVMQHEIGHGIGLGHTQTDGSVPNHTSNIMHFQCCSLATPMPPALGPDDLAGLAFIYPVASSECSFTLNPTSASITNSAQTGNVSVLTSSACGWTVSTSTDWLRIDTPTSNTGGGTVQYTASANAGPAREGLLTVAGMNFRVTQAIGASTVTAVSPTSGSFHGGTSITVTGTNFAGVPGVTVGGTAATSVSVVSTTSLTAVTPAGSLGPKTVSVTTNAGTGSLANGFTYTCGFTLSPASAAAPVGGATGSTVTVTTPAGCAWTAVSNDSFITVTAGATGDGNGTVTYSVAAMPGTLQGRAGTITIGDRTFTVTQGTPPTMTLDRTSLNFGAATTGQAFTHQTQPQIVRLTQSHAGAVTWTATSNRAWLTVSPSSGTGAAILSVGVTFHTSAPTGSTDTGSITLTFSGAANNPGPVTVNLQTYVGATSPPVGAFELPDDGATGISGSIAVTGWALDDLDVARVRIVRDPVSGEGASLIPIGNAVLVEGARLDLIPVFPTTPRNTRGGWGYLVLTNFLPNGGNGTFRLHAFADDVEGHAVLLGSKTITVDNANATKPFGAIDTPAQGETISG
ncbi:MAG: IPT/TIG domain-containing protein, partial [Vicinamibacterales bacterium]